MKIIQNFKEKKGGVGPPLNPLMKVSISERELTVILCENFTLYIFYCSNIKLTPFLAGTVKCQLMENVLSFFSVFKLR